MIPDATHLVLARLDRIEALLALDREPAVTAYLSDRAVAARFGVTRATIWRWAAAGTFPAPVKLGENATRWSLADLTAWERRQQQAAAK